MLRWEEPRNRYDQLFWQAEHFACIGQGLQDSPLRPLSRVLQNLQVMDEVRRRWARCLTKNAKEPAGHWFADSASVSAIARQKDAYDA